MSLEKYSTQKISENTLQLISKLTSLRDLADYIVNYAAVEDERGLAETLQDADGLFADVDNSIQALKTSFVVLTNAVTGKDEQESEDGIDVQVTPTENGFKF